MDYLPVFLDLRGRTALLVGGGRVALRKAELLVAAGARLRVVAPRILPELAQLVAASGGECHPGRFAPQHLDGVVLAIVATGVAEVDAAVQRAALARALPVNVADRQELCSFILPAVVDRSPVIVAFSTGGGRRCSRGRCGHGSRRCCRRGWGASRDSWGRAATGCVSACRRRLCAGGSGSAW